jgi:uncharacterized protein (UPF0335 family)
MTKPRVQEYLEKANELEQIAAELRHEVKEIVEQLARGRRSDVRTVLEEIFGPEVTQKRES